MIGPFDRNKIYNMDCLEAMKQMPDGCVDMVLTDPPYGDGCAYGRNSREIENNDNPLFGMLVASKCYRLLRDKSYIYMFLDVKHYSTIESFFIRYTDFTVVGTIVWDKVNFGMGIELRHQHELILILRKGKQDVKNKSTPNILSEPRVVSDNHPHEKPVQLVIKLLKHSTEKKNTILDPFMGSGTTAVACIKTDRNFIGFETDKGYYEIANKRIKAEQAQMRLAL